MTKVTKAANYDQKTIDSMVKMYTGKDNKKEVSAIAAKFQKSVPSVRAKLSSLGLYVTEKKATGSTSTRTKKADIVASIAAQVGGLSDAEKEGLEKATSVPLQKILDKLTAKKVEEKPE